MFVGGTNRRFWGQAHGQYYPSGYESGVAPSGSVPSTEFGFFSLMSFWLGGYG